MTAVTNNGKLRQNKNKTILTAKQILAFASSPNIVRKVKHLPLNFKQIV